MSDRIPSKKDDGRQRDVENDSRSDLSRGLGDGTLHVQTDLLHLEAGTHLSRVAFVHSIVDCVMGGSSGKHTIAMPKRGALPPMSELSVDTSHQLLQTR
jgi:hypothetical protein